MCFNALITWLTPHLLVIMAGLASAGLLAVALVAQYGFELHPCDLCIYQRYPYVAVALLGGAACFIRNRHLLIGMGWVCVLLFSVDAAIAGYHAGVELGWFPGLSGCTNTIVQGQTLEDMRRAILEAPLVTCDQPMLTVLGLSMAAWNGIAALSLAILMAVLLMQINQSGGKAS